MTATAPAPSTTSRKAPRAMGLVRGNFLQLRKRRGLLILSSLLTFVAMIIGWGIATIIHLANATKHPAIGDTSNFAGSMQLLSLTSLVIGAAVGATQGADELSTGVYRDLVLTGRSRRDLFLSRLPSGFAYVVPFFVIAVAIAALWAQAAPNHHGTPSFTLAATTVLWLSLQCCFWYVCALALGAIIGSRGFAITTALAFVLVVSNILNQLTALGRLRYALPSFELSRIGPHPIRTMMGDPHGVHVPLTQAWIFLVIWVVVMGGTGLWRMQRRDV